MVLIGKKWVQIKDKSYKKMPETLNTTIYLYSFGNDELLCGGSPCFQEITKNPIIIFQY